MNKHCLINISVKKHKKDNIDGKSTMEDNKPTVAPASSEDNPVNYLLVIGTVIGIFAVLLVSFALYNHYATPEIKNIGELHTDNLMGEDLEEEAYVYNGYSFLNIDGLWFTEVEVGDNVFSIPLRFGPQELENVTIDGSLTTEFYMGNEIYISFDPTVESKYLTLAASELATNLNSVYDLSTMSACSVNDNSTLCNNRQVISCDNNPDNLPLIELSYVNETSIELSGTCVKLSGTEWELVRAVDRLLLSWYGVY